MKLNGMFQQMRDILQPTHENAKAPLNWGLLEDAPPPEDICKKLAALRNKAQRMCARKTLCTGDRKAWRTIRRMMESYADRLDPIIKVRGSIIILPRTNNICEIGFRDFKRRQRRTTGNSNLARQLDQLPAQAFYAENLSNPEYCRIVFAGKAMHECFAEIDLKSVRKAVEAMKSPANVGAVDRKLIADPEFYQIVRQGLAVLEPEKLTARAAS
ncbi:MAG: hypothetical protein HQ567_10910 [Candidatus Nealsonbacteria bacterium]|nr:hypothetical protein [Candidatus Nealsonbacteria bacterium]